MCTDNLSTVRMSQVIPSDNHYYIKQYKIRDCDHGCIKLQLNAAGGKKILVRGEKNSGPG